MSDPTGNAIKAAAIPDAREARLLALVEKWSESVRNGCRCSECEPYQVEREDCARELLAALRGDA